jgi:hypothetical protein
MTADIKSAIQEKLAAFASSSLREAAIGLLEVLGYRSERKLPLDPNTADNFVANFAGERVFNSGLAIELGFLGIQVDKSTRNFLQRQIELQVALHGRSVAQPQHFLNEARLSAIALALYLAALLETVPQDPAWPRVIVLDDVLIGLDMANRLPVLEVLLSDFSEWQVFLLTHDLTWFEMARTRLEGEPWLACEMYRDTDPTTGADRPLVKPPAGFLQRAKEHLAHHDLRAAASYARAAFETKLRKFCSEKCLPVGFRLNPAQVKSEDLLTATERHIKGQGQWGILGPRIQRVRMFRKIVLNPLIHPEIASITESDVRGAIDAVDKLRFDPAQGRPALDAAADLCSAADAHLDKETCVCCLRAAFEESLREFCKRRNVEVPWRDSTDLLKTRELWDSAKANARLTDVAQVPFVSAIEATAWLFLDDLDADVIAVHAPADFRAALTVLEERAPSSALGPVRRTKLDAL